MGVGASKNNNCEYICGRGKSFTVVVVLLDTATLRVSSALGLLEHQLLADGYRLQPIGEQADGKDMRILFQ